MNRLDVFTRIGWFDVLTCRKRLTILGGNTPAMPLHDAHFGGFFVSGGRK